MEYLMNLGLYLSLGEEKLEDGEKVVVSGKKYYYSELYERLESKEKDEETSPAICCPKCHKVEFSISYNNHECICSANCSCGHKMIIYEGC